MHVAENQPVNAVIDCGWGRLIFADTFASPEQLIAALRAESPGRRDIAFYVKDPHVLLAGAPHELFLDPSHAFRLKLSEYRPLERPRSDKPCAFRIRELKSQDDAEAVNRIYASHKMVTVPPQHFLSGAANQSIVVLVAEDVQSGEILGAVTGVDHARAIKDPSRGSSLWCLAVGAQARWPGIGESLVRRLAELLRDRGAVTLDLSVIHDNEQAIALYEKIGFKRLPVFTLKRKNPINERLFTGPSPDESLNPYAAIIVNEARRRGIHTEVTDAEGGFFRLTYGGRSIACRESLSEFTTGVAVSICDDKAVTRRVVSRAGVRTPNQITAGDPDELRAFLSAEESVVVKPARGEQGRGITVGLTDYDEVVRAIEVARNFSDQVLVETCVPGQDLRLVVIDYKVVAAAIRKPAFVIGDGSSSIGSLIEAQSQRRQRATDGESRIPMDEETERCVRDAGYTMSDVPESGVEIKVRRTANLHTGGTIHDVTDETHPALISAAVEAARAIHIPVTGIDLMVRSPRSAGYYFIEANERPGLANHEPRPTAERFVDLLFPLSMPLSAQQIRRKRQL